MPIDSLLREIADSSNDRFTSVPTLLWLFTEGQPLHFIGVDEAAIGLCIFGSFLSGVLRDRQSYRSSLIGSYALKIVASYDSGDDIRNWFYRGICRCRNVYRFFQRCWRECFHSNNDVAVVLVFVHRWAGRALGLRLPYFLCLLWMDHRPIFEPVQ